MFCRCVSDSLLRASAADSDILHCLCFIVSFGLPSDTKVKCKVDAVWHLTLLF